METKELDALKKVLGTIEKQLNVNAWRIDALTVALTISMKHHPNREAVEVSLANLAASPQLDREFREEIQRMIHGSRQAG